MVTKSSLPLFVALVVVAVSFQVIQGGGEEGEVSCDMYCQDYNYQCSPYGDGVDDGVNCESPFYKERCPATCKVCHKCNTTQQHNDQTKQLMGKIEELQKQVAALKSEKHLLIDHATSGKIYLSDPTRFGPQLLFDDILEIDTLKQGCFISENSNNNRWVALHLKEAHSINRVEILNRADHSFHVRLEGATIEACNDELTDCQNFGTVQNAPRVGWAVVKSSNENGIKGKAIKISQKAEWVNICEVRIFGN